MTSFINNFLIKFSSSFVLPSTLDYSKLSFQYSTAEQSVFLSSSLGTVKVNLLSSSFFSEIHKG